jgi:hypothetical protein
MIKIAPGATVVSAKKKTKQSHLFRQNFLGLPFANFTHFQFKISEKFDRISEDATQEGTRPRPEEG